MTLDIRKRLSITLTIDQWLALLARATSQASPTRQRTARSAMRKIIGELDREICSTKEQY